MKKTILMAVLLAVLAGTAVFAQEPAGNFRYDLNPEGNGIIIRQYVGNNPRLVIPGRIEGYPVVQIGTGRWSPIVPTNLLVSVVIPEGVRVIEESAFTVQANLTSVNFPSSLREIKRSAFHGSGLRAVRLPDSLEIIGSGAFSENIHLTDVNIPTGIKTIGHLAFYNCRVLSNVTIPASLRSINFETTWAGNPNYTYSNAFINTALSIATRRRLVELGYPADEFTYSY